MLRRPRACLTLLAEKRKICIRQRRSQVFTLSASGCRAAETNPLLLVHTFPFFISSLTQRPINISPWREDYLFWPKYQTETSTFTLVASVLCESKTWSARLPHLLFHLLYLPSGAPSRLAVFVAEKIDVEISRFAELLLLLLFSVFQLALGADALSVIHVVRFHHLEDNRHARLVTLSSLHLTKQLHVLKLWKTGRCCRTM